MIYNDRTKNSDEIIKMIQEAQQDQSHREHASLMCHLVEQIQKGLAYVLKEDDFFDLNEAEIQASVAGFQILGELASKTDGIWYSADTEASDVVLYKIGYALRDLTNIKLLTNRAYATALVSALEHVTAAAIIERKPGGGALDGAIYLLKKTIHKTYNQEFQSLLLPIMFRAYAHISAKKYISYDDNDVFMDALTCMSDLVRQIKPNQLSAIKEAMHCMVVMGNNMFRFQPSHLTNMCCILEHLSKINNMTHAAVLQILNVYALTTTTDWDSVVYISIVLRAIGEHSSDRVILKNAICILRKINIFLDWGEGINLTVPVNPTEILSVISKKYQALCAQNYKEDQSILPFENEHLKKIFDTGQKLIDAQQYRTLIYVSQFLDARDIDPCYVVDIKKYAQFMKKKPKTTISTKST